MNIMEDVINDRKKKGLAVTIIIPEESLKSGELKLDASQLAAPEEESDIEDGMESEDGMEDDSEDREKLDQPPSIKKDEELLVGDHRKDLLRKKKDGRGPSGLIERAMMDVVDKG